MKSLSIAYLLISVMTMLFFSCLNQPKEIVPDPCANRIQTTADFTIIETIEANSNWINYDTDTVCTNQVTFTALFTSPGTTFLWNIGLGVYTTSSVNIYFSVDESSPIYVPINVKLTVNNPNPDKVCFPGDEGSTQTKIRSMVFAPWESTPINGTWYGIWNGDDTDTATIFIDVNHPNNVDSTKYGRQFYTKGFLSNGCETNTSPSDIAFKEFYFESGLGWVLGELKPCDCTAFKICNNTSTLLRVKENNNSIEITTYTDPYIDPITNLLKNRRYVFEGKRKLTF